MQELILTRKSTAPTYTDNFGVEHPNAYVKVISVANNQADETLQINWAIWHNESAFNSDLSPIYNGTYHWTKEAREEGNIPYSSYANALSAMQITTVTKLAAPAIQWVLNYQPDPFTPEQTWGEDWEVVE